MTDDASPFTEQSQSGDEKYLYAPGETHGDEALTAKVPHSRAVMAVAALIAACIVGLSIFSGSLTVQNNYPIFLSSNSGGGSTTYTGNFPIFITSSNSISLLYNSTSFKLVGNSLSLKSVVSSINTYNGAITLKSGANSEINITNSSRTITLYNNWLNETRKSFLYISYGEGAGGECNFQMGEGSDGKVDFQDLDNFQIDDPGSNWNYTNSTYNVPYNGTYQIVTWIRVTDGTGADNDGVGGALPGELDIGSHDYPGFGWFGAGTAFRVTWENTRVINLTAGQQILMATYSDNFDCSSDGYMAISLLFPTS